MQVRPVGPLNADIMLVGEAPGEQEAVKGIPFIGPSGQLLDELMYGAQIIRGECYITNVIKVRPRDNNIKPFINLEGKVPIESDEYKTYLLELRQEIERVNPNVIVAVGAVSLYALCGLQGITKWRGSVLESTLCPGKKVIPILHPAAALRTYIWRHFIAFDLKKVRKHSEFPDIPRDTTQYYLKPTFEDAMGYLDYMKSKSLVASDIEISKGTVSCISFAGTTSEVMSIPFVYNGYDYFNEKQEAAIWRKIDEIYADPNIAKVGQNFVFDTTFLNNRYGIRPRNLHDTMVAQAILYPEFPKDLGHITSQYTDFSYYKDEGKSVMRDQMQGINMALQSGSSGMTRQEAFLLYNAKDSVVLMVAFPKQMQELINRGLWQTYERQVSLIQPIIYITARGIRMDTEGMAEESRNARIKFQELSMKLRDITGEPLNPNSPKQLKEYFYGKKRIPPYKKKGVVSTDEKAMKQIKARGYKEADIILEMRSLKKADGTYYTMKVDSDNRMRSSINPVGTRFGRLSMSQTIFGTGGNLQTMPLHMKKYMLVDEGYVGYNVDLSQAENRVVAYVAPDPEMIHAFENGIDIHAKTASLIFQIPVEEILRMDKAGVKAPLGNGEQTHRFWGKKSNHGLNYDLGPNSFALHLEIPVKQAKWLHAAYHRAYPGVKASYHSRIQNDLRRTRTLTNLMGRKCYFAERMGDQLFKEGYAFIPQSTVADVMNERGVLYLWKNADEFHDVEILLQVHDSIVFQIPLSIPIEEHARILLALKKSLEIPLEANGRTFVIPADIKMHARNYYEGFELKAKSFPTDIETATKVLKSSYASLVN